jgi:hypothetical protein
MPESFAFPPGEADASDVWVPLQIDPALPVNDHSVFLLGRLKPGVEPRPRERSSRRSVAQRGEAGTAHRWDPDGPRSWRTACTTRSCSPCPARVDDVFGAVFSGLIACVNVG